MAGNIYTLDLCSYDTDDWAEVERKGESLPVISRGGTAAELLPFAEEIVKVLRACAAAPDLVAEVALAAEAAADDVETQEEAEP